MFKKFQILLMIFCLGIFIIPKQGVFAQTMNEMDCCKIETTQDMSCHDTGKEKQESKDSCKDCANCNHCMNLLQISLDKPEVTEINSAPVYAEKSDFSHANPHLSFGLKDIWQPPKIG